MRPILSIVLVLLFSVTLTACIEGTLLDFSPNTDVYVSNNTGSNFTVSIQISSAAALQEGRDWTRYSETLAPYSTAKLISFERNKGFARDQEYVFDIQLSNEAGETLTLQQHIKGTAANSELRFGSFADDLVLTLFTDRSLHRVSSNFIQATPLASEIAVQAKTKARYDDLYYALTPAVETPSLNEDANRLSLISYNIGALPLVSKNIKERLQAIPDYIQGYDVVVLQEAFSDHRENLFLTMAQTYPYQTRMLDKEGVNVHDGGVIIFSRFPILDEAQIIFPDCADADCLADKGVNYAAVNKNGRVYHVFATHTASFDTSAARAYRQKQFTQMQDFTVTLAIPVTDTVIYAGDLNVNKLKFPDDYQNMLSTLQSSEPVYAGYTLATFDPRINIHATSTISGGSVEYLDYILLSDSHKPMLNNTNVVKVPRSSQKDFWQTWDLSDHFPVAAMLQ